MAITQTYAFGTLAATSLASLPGTGWANSAEFNNSAGTYQEVTIGGIIVWGASHVAGNEARVYLRKRLSAAATDTTAAIAGDALVDAVKTEGTDFSVENLIPLCTVHCDGASQTQHWGGYSAAEAFGGTVPAYWAVIVNNVASGAALGASGHAVTTEAVQFASA